MRRIALFATIALAMLLFVVAQAQTPQATPLVDRCDGLVEYRQAIADAFLDLSDDDRAAIDRLDAVGGIDLEPDEAQAASDAYSQFAENLEDIPEEDIPAVAHDFHDAVIAYVDGWAEMLDVLAKAGVGGAMAYGFAAATEDEDALDAANAEGQRQCGPLWDNGPGDIFD